jgi:ribosomal protein S18 acetylase RimI-like enzyme
MIKNVKNFNILLENNNNNDLVFKQVSIKNKHYYDEIYNMMKDLIENTIKKYHFSSSLKLSVNLKPDKLYFVLENSNKEILGMAIVWGGKLDPSTLTIDDFYIKPKYRRYGYGSFMLNELENFAKKRKFKTMNLKVNKENKSALNLYTNFGFYPSEYIMIKKI